MSRQSRDSPEGRERLRKYYQENRGRYLNTARARNLRVKYGISLDDYATLLAKQDGGCALCKAPPPTSRLLCVDHDHATGTVRGLLCILCNTSLERVERHGWIAQAQKYLALPRTPPRCSPGP